MNSIVIRLCERLSLLFGVLAVIVCVALGQPWLFTGGVAAGAAVGLVNFVGFRMLVARLVEHISSEVDRPPSKIAALLFLKIIAALGVSWLLISLLKFDPLGFGLGLSLVVGTITFVPFFANEQAAEARDSNAPQGVALKSVREGEES